MGRRTLAESLYLLTAPVTAAAGLVLAFGGLCVATVGLLVPGGSPVVAGALARPGGAPTWNGGGWPGWATRPAGRVRASGRDRSRPAPRRPRGVARRGARRGGAPGRPGHLGSDSGVVVGRPRRCHVRPAGLRDQYASSGPLRPMTLYAGSPESHVAVSLGLTSPAGAFAFGITIAACCCWSPCLW